MWYGGRGDVSLSVGLHTGESFQHKSLCASFILFVEHIEAYMMSVVPEKMTKWPEKHPRLFAPSLSYQLACRESIGRSYRALMTLPKNEQTHTSLSDML
jgi:hypothetical protein